jgi:osmotically-inducible protein OsmY
MKNRKRPPGRYRSLYDVGTYASYWDEGERLSNKSMSKQALMKGVYRGKGPRGYQRSDERILEDINDRLFIDSFIDASGIEVQVNNCDVILLGTVQNRNAKRRAEDIAESVSGVKNVENRIRIAGTRVVGPVRSNVREELM